MSLWGEWVTRVCVNECATVVHTCRADMIQGVVALCVVVVSARPVCKGMSVIVCNE